MGVKYPLLLHCQLLPCCPHLRLGLCASLALTSREGQGRDRRCSHPSFTKEKLKQAATVLSAIKFHVQTAQGRGEGVAEWARGRPWAPAMLLSLPTPSLPMSCPQAGGSFLSL